MWLKQLGTWSIVYLVCLVAGCGGKAGKKDIVVFYPCGQGGPFVEAAKLWNQSHADSPVVDVQDNVVVLIRRIESGEHPDVFLGLGDHEVEYLERKGLVDSKTVVAYAGNHLCVVVPRAKQDSIKKLEDLKSERIKSIAFPDPTYNSVGFHARELLKKQGLWDAIQKKLIKVSKPFQAMMMVTTAKADACFAYEPCLAAIDTTTGKLRWKSKKTVMAVSLRDVEGGIFPILGAVVKGAKNPNGAKAFLKFLESEAVRKIYAKWGFDPVPVGPKS